MRLPHNCHILVADGRKMLLLRNGGMADDPKLSVDYGEEQPNPADHEQKSDLAGRRPAIGGLGGQSSVSETDYHQQTEDDFAKRTAEHLNAMALRNELEALVIVASGKTLGELRKHFHKEVQSRIIAEVDKLMTGAPTNRIAQMLMELDAVA